MVPGYGEVEEEQVGKQYQKFIELDFKPQPVPTSEAVKDDHAAAEAELKPPARLWLAASVVEGTSPEVVPSDHWRLARLHAVSFGACVVVAQ